MKAQGKRMSGKKMYELHGHAIDTVARFMETDAMKLARQLSRHRRAH